MEDMIRIQAIVIQDRYLTFIFCNISRPFCNSLIFFSCLTAFFSLYKALLVYCNNVHTYHFYLARTYLNLLVGRHFSRFLVQQHRDNSERHPGRNIVVKDYKESVPQIR